MQLYKCIEYWNVFYNVVFALIPCNMRLFKCFSWLHCYCCCCCCCFRSSSAIASNSNYFCLSITNRLAFAKRILIQVGFLIGNTLQKCVISNHWKIKSISKCFIISSNRLKWFLSDKFQIMTEFESKFVSVHSNNGIICDSFARYCSEG